MLEVVVTVKCTSDMSKLCFFIFFYTFFTRYGTECGVANTGTVLFSNSDVHRQCWHPEEIAVLTTRMVLQDVVPDAKYLEINDSEYVDDIVDYFKLLFEVVQKSTKGRARHITMLALSDLIGGYLQHVVLPKGRLAYYAGVIDYFSMEKLIQFYEELKWFLRTNGQGWSSPMKLKDNYEIEPIDLTTEVLKGNRSCCRNLIYYQRSPLRRGSDKDTSKSLFFPVPFFDAKVRPSAIAVPFRRFALRSIESKRAAYMVMKYYVSVQSCLKDLQADKPTFEGFRDRLFSWIEKNVIPKLGDEKFYSAFGGILRVLETLKSEGAKIYTINPSPECVENEGDQELGTIPGGETSSRSSILLIVMLVTIFIWFILGTLFICYRIRTNSRKKALRKMANNYPSSSSFGSSSKSWSSKRTQDTCKCCTSERSTDGNSSMSSKLNKGFLDSSFKNEPRDKNICVCEKPAFLDHKQTMKFLPSIPEISENSSSKRDDWKERRRISFEDPLSTSSAEDLTKPKKKIRICMPRLEDVDVTACPRYATKGTSASSGRSKSSGKDQGLQISPSKDDAKSQTSEPEVQVIKGTTENTTDETPSDGTVVTGNAPHIYACHSSLTGNYNTEQRFYSTEKPFIFGYDFQTSTSSDLSDEESDVRSSTTR